MAALAHLLRQERNRQHALAQRPHQHPAVPASVARVIDALAAELADMEQAIQAHVQRHVALAAAVRRPRTLLVLARKVFQTETDFDPAKLGQLAAA